MERQKHGFNYENNIINQFKMEKEPNYTSKFDARYNNRAVSIKVAKAHSDIELGDYFRQSMLEEDFYLFVGFWSGEKDNIIEEYTLFIPKEEWTSLFDLSFNEKFRNLLNNITNDYSDDEKWKNSIKSLRKEWSKKTQNLIRPRFKRDHKKQKRIQCAINYRDFIEYFVKKFQIEVLENEGNN